MNIKSNIRRIDKANIETNLEANIKATIDEANFNANLEATSGRRRCQISGRTSKLDFFFPKISTTFISKFKIMNPKKSKIKLGLKKARGGGFDFRGPKFLTKGCRLVLCQVQNADLIAVSLAFLQGSEKPI